MAVITVNTGVDITDAQSQDPSATPAVKAALSLRQAIEISNGTLAISSLDAQQQALVVGPLSSPNTINFNIPTTDSARDPKTGVFHIFPPFPGLTSPSSMLSNGAFPTITSPVTIDGFSQPGAHAPQAGSAPVLLIELDGASNVHNLNALAAAQGSAPVTGTPSDGLTVASPGVTVQGLVINRFDGSGIVLRSSGTTIRDNIIGAGADGNPETSLLTSQSPAALPPGFIVNGNLGDGILVDFAGYVLNPVGLNGGLVNYTSTNNLIGGNTPDAANIIAYNQKAGVGVKFGAGNAIGINSIHDNGALGLDLGTTGIPRINGSSPSSLAITLDYPVLTSATAQANGSGTIAGTYHDAVPTASGQSYVLRFYSNPTADPSGFGQGRTYLGTATVTTDASGAATFSVPIAGGLTAGQVVSATAIDAQNNTSEFSKDLVVATDTGPTVTGVSRYGYHAQPTFVVLSFNSPLAPATAQDAANYAIVGPLSRTEMGGRAVGVRSATYDSTAGTVTLALDHRLNVHWRYRLTVNGTTSTAVTSLGGTKLDGSNNGSPGGDYVAFVTLDNLAGKATHSGPVLGTTPQNPTAARHKAVDHLLATGKLHATPHRARR